MIRVIYIILSILIKDLEVHLDNLNLLLRKNIIRFESLVQKEDIGKQTIDILY